MAETAELQNHVKNLEGLFVGLEYMTPEQANGAVDDDFLKAWKKFVEDFMRISDAKGEKGLSKYTDFTPEVGEVFKRELTTLLSKTDKIANLERLSKGEDVVKKTAFGEITVPHSAGMMVLKNAEKFGDLAVQEKLPHVLEFVKNSGPYIASMNAVHANQLTLSEKPVADKPAADQPTSASNPITPPTNAPAEIEPPKPMTAEEASVTAENGIAVMAGLIETMAKQSKQTDLTLVRPDAGNADFDAKSQQALQGVISGLRLGGIITEGVNNFYTPEIGAALKAKLDAMAASEKAEDIEIYAMIDGSLKDKAKIKGGVDEFLLSLNTLHANKKLADKDLDTGAKIQMLGMQMSVQDIEMVKGVLSAITQIFPGAMTFLNGLAKQFFNKDLNELIPGLMPETAVASAAPEEKPAEPAKPVSVSDAFNKAGGVPVAELAVATQAPGVLSTSFNAEANQGPAQPEAPSQTVVALALTDEERAARTALRLQELTDNSGSLTSQTAVAAVGESGFVLNQPVRVMGMKVA